MQVCSRIKPPKIFRLKSMVWEKISKFYHPKNVQFRPPKNGHFLDIQKCPFLPLRVANFKNESQKLQKVCPKRLDAETDLYTVQWSEPYFTYTFRLTHLNTRSIDTLLFKNLVLPGIKTEICLRDDSILCKKLGVIFCYRYLNSKSEYLCSIRQSYQTCNELPVKNAP